MSVTNTEAPGGQANPTREAVGIAGEGRILPPNPEHLIQKWKTEVNAAKMARVPFEREWYQNIAFMFGRQWLMWDAAASSTHLGSMIEPKVPPHRVRITVNRVRKLVNKQYAKLCKEQIRGFIAPSTTDDSDIAAARAGERLNTYLIDLTKLQERLNRTDWWMLTCGTGFSKDYYNESIKMAGPEEEDPMTGEKRPSTMMGAPVVETISPFHIFVSNIDEPDIDLQDWICHVAVRTRSQIMDQYQVDPGEDAKLAGSSIEAKLQAAQGYKSNTSKKGIEVFELWAKPCTEYPEGMVLTWCNDIVLGYYPEWPYAHKEYPFTRRQFLETGRFYGESIIVDLRPLQMEYNRTRSQIIEDKNRMARPMMAVQQGSINANAVQGRPGEMIMYKPGTPPPAPIQMPNIPNYVVEHLQHLQEEMSDLAEQRQLEQGIPSGVTAATAISYLQENQDEVLSECLRDKERAYQRICRHLLGYVVQFWDAERQIKVVGQDQNFETYLLSATNLRGNTDWHVVAGSATPQSRAAKQALLMELMKMGILPADKGLQFLDMGDTARVFEEMQVDVREAERQNLHMAQGEPQDTNDWQNLLVHIQVHDNYRKREEYEALEDQPKMIFRHHVFKDMFLLAKQLAPELVASIPSEVMTPQIPPQMMMMNPEMAEMAQYYVPDMVEEALRGFIISLQSGGMGAAPAPQSNTASSGGPPQ